MVLPPRPTTREAKKRVDARLGYQIPVSASLPELAQVQQPGAASSKAKVAELQTTHSRVAAEGAFTRVAALMGASSAIAPGKGGVVVKDLKESQTGRPYLQPMHARPGNPTAAMKDELRQTKEELDEVKKELKQAEARNQLQENVWVEREIVWKREQREKSKKEVHASRFDTWACRDGVTGGARSPRAGALVEWHDYHAARSCLTHRVTPSSRAESLTFPGAQALLLERLEKEKQKLQKRKKLEELNRQLRCA